MRTRNVDQFAAGRGAANPIRSRVAASVAVLLCGAAVPVLAADEAADSAAADQILQEVVVFGRGETRQLQGIDAAQIDYLPAGTSPLKAIEKLPGVNFQSADPFGSYEWSTRIVVRGFNQNQLGFTLDGVPLGDMSYGNHNGLHVSRAVPTENVGRVLLSQGAGALATASSNNLGGTIEFYSIDPSREFDGQLELTGGSDSTRRVFGRIESGELGATGTRFYISAADGLTEKWKGAGDQEQRMANFKVVQPIGDATLTGYYNWSDRAEADYQDLSFAILNRRGSDWDNYFPDYTAAISAAQACAAGGFAVPICDDAYWNAAGLREDSLGYLTLDLPVGEALNFRVTGYMHRNEGQGLWGTPYVATPGGAPLTVRTTEYDIDRRGLIANAAWTLGAHKLEAGVWYEDNEFNQSRRFYPELSLAGPTQDFTQFLRNPLLTQWEHVFDTRTLQFHVQDTWEVSDALRLNFGFKSMQVENDAWTVQVMGAPNFNASIEADEGFLPQVGFAWTLSDTNEVFGQFAQNTRAFVSAKTAGPFSSGAAAAPGFSQVLESLNPETSTTVELGWRFRATAFEGVLSAYQVKFDDRLLAIQQGPSILGNAAILANVGSVTSQGLEAALSWRPMQYLTWFNSFAWNDSQYDDNFTSNGVVVPVAGKQVVDAPKVMIKSELAWDNGRFFARVDGNYVGKRFYTYLNQGGVNAQTLFNGSVGYRFANAGLFEELTVQGAVTNIADEFYISTIGSGGFTNADPGGTAQTLLRGAPRQFFVTLKASF
jgi:iron complex outermembrane receptor protein